MNHLETQYDDVIKILWAQPHYVSGTGAVLSAAWGAIHVGASLATDQDGYAHAELAIPSDFRTISRAVAMLAINASGHIYIAIDTNWGTNGEAPNTHTDTIAVAEVAVSSGLIKEYDITAAFTNLAANDYVGIRLKRTGTNGLDDAEETLYVLGFLIEYN